MKATNKNKRSIYYNIAYTGHGANDPRCSHSSRLQSTHTIHRPPFPSKTSSHFLPPKLFQALDRKTKQHSSTQNRRRDTYYHYYSVENCRRLTEKQQTPSTGLRHPSSAHHHEWFRRSLEKRSTNGQFFDDGQTRVNL